LVAVVTNDQGHERYLEFLIDTGADYTFISYSHAILLGLDYHSIQSPEKDFDVANSTSIKAKKIYLTIKIGNKNILTPVFIANQPMENLLGRRGIFDHYEIVFQESKKQVIFTEV